MQQPDAHTIDTVVLIITIGALAIGLLSMLVGRVVAWWDALRGVNAYEEEEAERAPESAPSVLETDSRQTADRPMMPVPAPDKMLDIFRVLRAHGIKRQEIESVWRAAGLRLDNNLWSKAAPPSSEPASTTPIAGRPYDPRLYQDDPELEYQAPPR